MSDDAREREKAYRRRVRQSNLGFRLARSAFRKKKSWLDRIFTRLVQRTTASREPDSDFMRDEIVDAGIGFDAGELDRYQGIASATREAALVQTSPGPEPAVRSPARGPSRDGSR